MEIVILLVPLGLFLAGLAVAAFMWGLRRGQFEDLESRGWEVVFDDRADRREQDTGAHHEHKDDQPEGVSGDVPRPGHESASIPRKTGGRQ